MWGQVTIKTPAAVLPLTAADLRARLNIDDATGDPLLVDFIRAAVSEVDGPAGIGVAIMAQTWTLTLDRLPARITLPGAPVTGVSAIRYLDATGAWVVIPAASYRLAAGSEPARIVLAPGASWPAVAPGAGVVEVDYQLGAATAAAADPGLVTAVAMLAGHYFENREAVAAGVTLTEAPLGARHILERHRRGVVG